MPDRIRRLVIHHCGPVFMGIKPAALFPFRPPLRLESLFALMPRNVDLFILRETAGGFLILLYEKTLLENALRDGAHRRFLSGLGYPVDAENPALPLPPVLDCLKTRFAGGGFPHEVGLFLGYPLEDVCGFIRHRGRNCKLCGYWKVYGDVERAKKLFRQYDLCREYLRLSVNEWQRRFPWQGAANFFQDSLDSVVSSC